MKNDDFYFDFSDYYRRNRCAVYPGNRYTRIVRKNSCALKKLEKINGSYRFSDCENLDEEHTYDNSAFFDTISCEDYLIYQLQFQQYRILRETQNALCRFSAQGVLLFA